MSSDKKKMSFRLVIYFKDHRSIKLTNFYLKRSEFLDKYWDKIQGVDLILDASGEATEVEFTNTSVNDKNEIEKSVELSYTSKEQSQFPSFNSNQRSKVSSKSNQREFGFQGKLSVGPTDHQNFILKYKSEPDKNQISLDASDEKERLGM